LYLFTFLVILGYLGTGVARIIGVSH
jgi:hypothetical protein